MSGNLESALQGIPDAAAVRGAMARSAEVARARYQGNLANGIRVVRTTERIVADSVRVSGETAVLQGQVVLERYMAPAAGHPEKWVESGEYRFTFQRQDGNRWVLTRYEEVDPFDLSGREPGEEQMPPKATTPAATDPGSRRGRPTG
ncbi:MAG TPA: hypothetical protein VEY93_12665, partial [Longimicrobium sp.]|nr:hypothetical protein [Longimicrobium sp.]